MIPRTDEHTVFTARDAAQYTESSNHLLADANKWLKGMGFDTWSALFATMPLPEDHEVSNDYVELLVDRLHNDAQLDHRLWAHATDAIRLHRRAQHCLKEVSHWSEVRGKSISSWREYVYPRGPQGPMNVVHHDATIGEDHARYLVLHFQGEYTKAINEANYFFQVVYLLMLHLKYLDALFVNPA